LNALSERSQLPAPSPLVVMAGAQLPRYPQLVAPVERAHTAWLTQLAQLSACSPLCVVAVAQVVLAINESRVPGSAKVAVPEVGFLRV
jgi:hypothetical protein